VLRERELHEDPVDLGVPIQFADHFEQFRLRYFGSQGMVFGPHTQFLAGFHLARDVHGRGGIFAHAYDCKTRLVRKSVDPYAYLGFNGVGDLLAAQYLSCHLDNILPELRGFVIARRKYSPLRFSCGKQFAGSPWGFGVFFGIPNENDAKARIPNVN
jgi:hypothetical protein